MYNREINGLEIFNCCYVAARAYLKSNVVMSPFLFFCVKNREEKRGG
jgi:hypothetical protein